MDVELSEERHSQLADYAQRHGQAPAAALDDIVADALEAERQSYQETIDGIGRAHADIQAGRTRPASEFMNELRTRHGF